MPTRFISFSAPSMSPAFELYSAAAVQNDVRVQAELARVEARLYLHAVFQGQSE